MKSRIVLVSHHNYNTQKVAEDFAKVFNANVVSPKYTILEELQEYDLVGFGSKIDSGKKYKELLDFADELPQVTNKKVFVFSTSRMPIGVSGQQRLEEYTNKYHTTLKKLSILKAQQLLVILAVLVLTLTSPSSILVESTKVDLTVKISNELKSSFKIEGVT